MICRKGIWLILGGDIGFGEGAGVCIDNRRLNEIEYEDYITSATKTPVIEMTTGLRVTRRH